MHTFVAQRAILISVNPNTLYSFCYTPLVTKIPSPERALPKGNAFSMSKFILKGAKGT